MSGRGADVANLAEWGADYCHPVHLLEMDFNPWVYLTDAAIDVSWNGNSYLASQFLGFGPIQETSELLVNTCSISLSGVDSAVVAILLQESYLNRHVKIRTAMLDSSLALIGTPVLVFDGRMDNPTITITGDTVTVIVDGVSHWTDFDRRAGRHTNDAEQQTFFPGDRGFQPAGKIPKTVFWGARTELPASMGTPWRGRFRR